MKKSTPREARFIFFVADQRNGYDFVDSISDIELRRIGLAGGCVTKIRRLLPRGVITNCTLEAGEIHLVVIGDETQADAFDGAVALVQLVVVDLNRLIERMSANANSSAPVPVSSLSLRAGDVDFLRALVRAQGKDGLDLEVRIDDHRMPMERLHPSDFTEGMGNACKFDEVRHRIVGLRRDDLRGHLLLLTEEEIRVRLPLQDWPFSRIQDVLLSETIFEARIGRADRGEWCADVGASIERPRNMS